MIINSHDLVYASDAGNGFHGRCSHCGVPLVTDLGYCSWEGVKCIDREVVNYIDIPAEIIKYANFFGLHWDRINKTFNKSYSEETFTIDDINDKIQKLKI